MPRDRHYNERRLILLFQPVHLVEIDLLIGGQRLPMRDPLPHGDSFALISRAGRWPECQAYAWSIRRQLPRLPIPLLSPDPDITIDLAELYTTAYERGRYAELINYRNPLKLPLAPEDRVWAEELARTAVR